MISVRVEQIYHNYIESLSFSDQLQLITLMSQRLASHTLEIRKTKTHSLLELEGLGAEIWQGVDAQKYVNELRDEWEIHT